MFSSKSEKYNAKRIRLYVVNSLVCFSIIDHWRKITCNLSMISFGSSKSISAFMLLWSWYYQTDCMVAYFLEVYRIGLFSTKIYSCSQNDVEYHVYSMNEVKVQQKNKQSQTKFNKTRSVLSITK